MNPQHNHTTITLLVRIKSVTVIPFQIRKLRCGNHTSSKLSQCVSRKWISIEPTKSDRSSDPHVTGSRQGEQRDRTDLQTVTVCFAKDWDILFSKKVQCSWMPWKTCTIERSEHSWVKRLLRACVLPRWKCVHPLNLKRIVCWLGFLLHGLRLARRART